MRWFQPAIAGIFFLIPTWQGQARMQTGLLDAHEISLALVGQSLTSKDEGIGTEIWHIDADGTLRIERQDEIDTIAFTTTSIRIWTISENRFCHAERDQPDQQDCYVIADMKDDNSFQFIPTGTQSALSYRLFAYGFQPVMADALKVLFSDRIFFPEAWPTADTTNPLRPWYFSKDGTLTKNIGDGAGLADTSAWYVAADHLLCLGDGRDDPEKCFKVDRVGGLYLRLSSRKAGSEPLYLWLRQIPNR